MIASEKVPFDIVEAESELIDGITTEFEGYAFSLIYAAELIFGLVTLKMFSSVLGFVALFPLFGIVLLSFVGRIFLSRFLLPDILELCLSIGLILSIVVLVTVLDRNLGVFCPKSTTLSINNAITLKVWQYSQI